MNTQTTTAITSIPTQLKPLNWREKQNYKYRMASWVRCYGKEMLDDPSYCNLPIEAKALFIPLWALAAESMNGVFTSTPKYLSFRFRGFSDLEIASGVSALISADFFVDASDELIDLTVPVSEATALRRANKEAEKVAEKQDRADLIAANKLNKVLAQAMARDEKLAKSLAEKNIQAPPYIEIVTTGLMESNTNKSIDCQYLRVGESLPVVLDTSSIGEEILVAPDF